MDTSTFVQKLLYCRQIVHYLMESPGSSNFAMVISWVNILVISLSCALIVLESLPELYGRFDYYFLACDVIFTVYFTIDYVIRLSTARRPFHWAIRFMSVVDFVATIPLYIAAAVYFIERSSLTLSVFFYGLSDLLPALRFFRVLRTARALKFGRHTQAFELILQSLQQSRSGLLMMSLLTAITVFMCSSFIYFAERGTWDDDSREWINEDGEVSSYQSIPGSFYWCITTLTTVGYGDIVPITIFGRIIASATMIVGVIGIAFPITIIGNSFHKVWYESEKERQKARREASRHAEVDESMNEADFVPPSTELGDVPASEDSLEPSTSLIGRTRVLSRRNSQILGMQSPSSESVTDPRKTVTISSGRLTICIDMKETDKLLNIWAEINRNCSMITKGEPHFETHAGNRLRMSQAIQVLQSDGYSCKLVEKAAPLPPINTEHPPLKIDVIPASPLCGGEAEQPNVEETHNNNISNNNYNSNNSEDGYIS
jgi:hypothetical protein